MITYDNKKAIHYKNLYVIYFSTYHRDPCSWQMTVLAPPGGLLRQNGEEQRHPGQHSHLQSPDKPCQRMGRVCVSSWHLRFPSTALATISEKEFFENKKKTKTILLLICPEKMFLALWKYHMIIIILQKYFHSNFDEKIISLTGRNLLPSFEQYCATR